MATKRMLVDAIHPEETRIVVTNGNRLEEFDFESATRRQLRGNIYLAKITRVEPSLQAAFIEYGGNRHGFLAFSEIHPDYYQIPVADREALLRQEEEDEGDHAAAEAAEPPSVAAPAGDDQNGHDTSGDEEGGVGNIEQAPSNNEPVESVGGSDALEDVQERRRPVHRRHQYKIQEVIKRRQVMLVQVVKEERGNKGAALTTYLSLAGRYSVLMPNTARGGGISRKITNAADRKRLKDIVGDLEVPPGQGIILRTAGASRTKAEVKRDFEYLQRLWENVRSLTLKSQAPCLVYEEGSLIKRTIRDLYSKEIDELWVAGDEAHREAKDFMRMIMPSHAKNVQLYKEDPPLFSKFNVEGQLDQMFSPQVTLPSGGYIVINPTEALVSIDVNSGRSTKEHNIEDTALQTNLEAADEVARQLRLRDLAGLIVIDFIDMEENRSNRAVERKLKDCLKNDRARIQVGRISHFGLMEMSRQRIRFGVVESSTHKCPTCQGTGLVRSVESLALMVMRNVEDHVLRKPGQSINLRVPTDVALYILNTKRSTLNGLEAKYGLSITVVADDHVGPSHFAIERGEPRTPEREQTAGAHVRVDTAAIIDEVADDADAMIEDEEGDEEAVAAEAGEPAARSEDAGERGGRRRRRRRRGGERGGDAETRAQPQAHLDQQLETQPTIDGEAEEGAEDEAVPRNGLDGNGLESDEHRKRRRRGRRGGRRNRRNEDGSERVEPVLGEDGARQVLAAEIAPGELMASELLAGEVLSGALLSGEAAAEIRNAESGLPESEADLPVDDAIVPETVAAEPVETPAAKPKRTRRKKADPAEETAAASAAEAAAPAEPVAAAETTSEEPAPKPRRTRARKPKAEPATAAEPARSEPTPSVTEPAAAPNTPETAPEPAPEPVTAAAESVREPEGQSSSRQASEGKKPEDQQPADEPESSAPRRARKEIPAGEILVSSSGAKDDAAEAAPAKPKKAGWWQRGFFGG